MKIENRRKNHEEKHFVIREKIDRNERSEEKKNRRDFQLPRSILISLKFNKIYFSFSRAKFQWSLVSFLLHLDTERQRVLAADFDCDLADSIDTNPCRLHAYMHWRHQFFLFGFVFFFRFFYKLNDWISSHTVKVLCKFRCCFVFIFLCFFLLWFT